MTTASGCDDPPSLGPLEIARKIPALPRAPIRGPSPGHQAGAPLRRMGGPAPAHRPGAFPRPSGRGSIAASIAACRSAVGVLLPPAIRPGLHCGATESLTVYSTPSTSPGHQAGAPLRLGDRAGPHPWVGWLPPAIRPGLHCGAAARSRSVTLRLAFPRPSGRGSIAADARRRGWWRAARSSPGHQAGAPLRRYDRVCTPTDQRELPPAIRPGLHCGSVGVLRAPAAPAAFPRPSGRGSIAAGYEG